MAMADRGGGIGGDCGGGMAKAVCEGSEKKLAGAERGLRSGERLAVAV